MTITAASDPEIIGFCIFYQILQSQNSSWNEGVFGGILYILAPIFEFNIWIDLYAYRLVKAQSVQGCKSSYDTFMIFL